MVLLFLPKPKCGFQDLVNTLSDVSLLAPVFISQNRECFNCMLWPLDQWRIRHLLLHFTISIITQIFSQTFLFKNKSFKLLLYWHLKIAHVWDLLRGKWWIVYLFSFDHAGCWFALLWTDLIYVFTLWRTGISAGSSWSDSSRCIHAETEIWEAAKVCSVPCRYCRVRYMLNFHII